VQCFVLNADESRGAVVAAENPSLITFYALFQTVTECMNFHN
jgi:hypothetical protein